MTRTFIGIGSNLGDRQAHVELARRALADLPDSRLERVSAFYETDPVGPAGQGKYLNGVAELQTRLAALALLDHLQQIEAAAGRPRPAQRPRWGPRTLDRDILLFGSQVISSDRLVVPHPLMHERWFVLKPLAELDPGVVHPLLEMTVGELLRYVEQKR